VGNNCYEFNGGSYDSNKNIQHQMKEDEFQVTVTGDTFQTDGYEKYEVFSNRLHDLCNQSHKMKFLGRFLLDESNHSDFSKYRLCQFSLTNADLLRLDSKCFADFKGGTLKEEGYHPYVIELLTTLLEKDVLFIKKKLYKEKWLEITLYDKRPQAEGPFFYGSFVFGASPLCRRRKYFAVSKVSTEMKYLLSEVNTVVDFCEELMEKYVKPHAQCQGSCQ